MATTTDRLDKITDILKDIEIKQGQMCTNLKNIVDQQTKIIFALIAIIGATLGLKIIGSPPLLIIMVYLNMFVFIFATLVALWKRKTFRWWFLIFGFGVFGLIANILRCTYEGNVSWWIQLLYVMANSLLVVFLWTFTNRR